MEAGHILAGHCHSCALCPYCTVRECTAVQCSEFKTSRSKTKSSAVVEMAKSSKAIHTEYLCQMCVRLVLSDLQKNQSSKYSLQMESVHKSGTYYKVSVSQIEYQPDTNKAYEPLMSRPKSEQGSL